MNFIAQVEENLRDLGSEARKKHPGVKEASERAILTLRSLQSQYVSAVRAATSSKNGSSTAPHPTTALFRSQDVLRPFLLACNYPDASSSLLLIGLNAIQLLINGDAVCPEDSVHIARVLGIQATCSCRNFQNEGSSSQQSRGSGGVMASLIGAASALPGGYYSSSSGSGHRTAKDDEAISLKVLQTLTIMIASKDLELSQEVLHQAITVCLTLISGNEGTKDEKNKKKTQRGTERDMSAANNAANRGNNYMRRAAAATLKQILLVTFERACVLLEQDSEFNLMTRTAAASAFSDLCVLSESREQGGDKLKAEVTGPFLIQGATIGKKRYVKPPPRSACFEILNMIINHTPALFDNPESEKKTNSEFAILLQFKTCPALSKVLLSEFYAIDKNTSSNNYDDHSMIENMSNKEQFSLLLRSTRLACTILQKFGKNKALANECHILLTALVRFVSTSSEAFRDSDKFEDGFIYSTAMQPSQDSDPQSSNSWRSTQIHTTDSYPLLISNNLLWRSALALESLFILIGDSEMIKFLYTFDGIQKDQKNLVALIAESISDFATTASSNKSGILSVVRAVSYRSDQAINNSDEINNILQPQIFARARHINKVNDDWESSLNEDNTLFHVNSPDTQFLDESEIPFCDDGEAIWLAFNCLLSLSSSMRTLSLDHAPQTQSLVECSFAPIMAVLQHFLKRFPFESFIRKKVLNGFRDLVDTCIPLGSVDGLHSEALIKTLCSLSLPNWGKIESNCQLKNQHIETISAIFEIIHKHHNELSSNWRVILATLEQLSCLSISSPHLSSSAYHDATAISDIFSRISSFSTCLSLNSLQCFIDALVQLSKQNSISTGQLQSKSENPDTQAQSDLSVLKFDEDDSQPNPSSSFGGKLMSFAGRAFTNQAPVNQETKSDITEQRVHSSKLYSVDFLNTAFSRMAIAKPTTKKEVFRTLPFSLILLTDVTLMNSFRFNESGKSVTNHLCDLASNSHIASVRAYAIDTLAMLVTAQLTGNKKRIHSFISQTKPVEESSLKNFLDVYAVDVSIPDETEDLEHVSHFELLSPLCQTIAETPAKDAAEAGLNSLYVILESNGHNLSGDAWPILISSISALSGAGPLRNSQSWINCGVLAFRCLKLIVDDFLDHLPVSPSPDATATRNALLHCCASFGQSQFDVNTSLTATGMLWTIADQDPSPNALESVLAKLAFLACDDRSEVRNCSVNTLFSCVVGLGYRFTSEQWKGCLEGTIFGVLDQVSSKMGSSHKSNGQQNATSSMPSRYRVSVHHTRDSNSKQWCATQVLTLRGIERVLRQFFLKLLVLGIDPSVKTSWFEQTWEQIIELAFSSANANGGRDSMELRIVGVDILVLCCQLSCEAGISAAATPVRVGTNMQVVNGALRSLNQKPAIIQQNQDNNTLELSNVDQQQFKETRSKFFLKAFDVLERFTDVLYHREEEEEENSYFTEPSILQVLTKLSQGLTKLYECCKGNELSPDSSVQYIICSKVRKEDLEGRFVNMINSVAIHAFGDLNSRYLTQAQRSCLDLLSVMCGHGSARAFERLAVMGGRAFFCRTFFSQEDDTVEVNDNNSAFELLEYEAAKNASDSFVKEGVSNTSKVVVLSMILKNFLEQESVTEKETFEDGKDFDKNDSYKLLISSVRGGLEAASLIGKGINVSNESLPGAACESYQSESVDSRRRNALLVELWDRVEQMLSSMLSQHETGSHTRFMGRTDAILEILSSCILYVPERSHENLALVLSEGALYAITVAKFERYPDQIVDDLCKDSLQVFEECIIGLGKCDPNSSILREIAENALRDILVSSLPKKENDWNSSLTENRQRNTDFQEEVEIEIALIVCEVLRTGSKHLTDLVIFIFPWLCKLTNIDEERIRKRAGLVLGSVDLSRFIARKTEAVREAEQCAREAKVMNEKLLNELNEIKVENERLRKEISRL